MTGDASKFAGDSFGREDVVYATGGDGAAGHAVVLGGLFVLREGYATMGLNLAEAGGSVGARAG